MPTDPVAVLARVGGAASLRELDGLVSRSALASALARGDVVRLARGRYALPEAPDPRRTAVRLAGVLSHESAAAHWGIELPVRRPGAQVTVGRGRSHLDPRGAEVHWSDLAPSEVVGVATSPLRTVLDLARARPLGTGLAAADSALRQQLVLPGDLRAAAQQLRGPGCLVARRVARWADPRAESPLESVTRAVVLGTGVRGFVPQVEVRGDDGEFVARLDLGDERRRLGIEADGFAHHGHRAGLARDCRRHSALTLAGWRVLRFAWEQVLFEPDQVAEAVRRLVRRR